MLDLGIGGGALGSVDAAADGGVGLAHPAHRALLDVRGERAHRDDGRGGGGLRRLHEGVGVREDDLDKKGFHALEGGGGHPAVDDTVDEEETCVAHTQRGAAEARFRCVDYSAGDLAVHIRFARLDILRGAVQDVRGD